VRVRPFPITGHSNLRGTMQAYKRESARDKLSCCVMRHTTCCVGCEALTSFLKSRTRTAERCVPKQNLLNLASLLATCRLLAFCSQRITYHSLTFYLLLAPYSISEDHPPALSKMTYCDYLLLKRSSSLSENHPSALGETLTTYCARTYLPAPCSVLLAPYSL